jgi:PhzF family phenazine biosynthesis protein
MEIEVYTMDVFAVETNGGNPAGVVLDANSLSKDDMQKIAKKVGLSETAFVQNSDNADYKVTFFTPDGEVDLCGHATVAVFYLLANKGIIQTGEYTQETKAGILKVECKNDGSIYMNQCNPEFYEKLDKKEIAETLNINIDDIMDDLPIQIVSTGLKDILIPIKSLETLYKIKPNFDKISRVSKKYNVTGYHLFTLETKFESIAHCRNFAPLYGIPEEAATGTSNGALSCYLYNYKIILEKNIKNLVFEQGYSMKKPSNILIDLITCDNKIIEVKVGGAALNIEKKKIKL